MSRPRSGISRIFFSSMTDPISAFSVLMIGDWPVTVRVSAISPVVSTKSTRPYWPVSSLTAGKQLLLEAGQLGS